MVLVPTSHLGHYLRASHSSLWSRINAIGEVLHATYSADDVVCRMDPTSHTILLRHSGSPNV